MGNCQCVRFFPQFRVFFCSNFRPRSLDRRHIWNTCKHPVPHSDSIETASPEKKTPPPRYAPGRPFETALPSTYHHRRRRYEGRAAGLHARERVKKTGVGFAHPKKSFGIHLHAYLIASPQFQCQGNISHFKSRPTTTPFSPKKKIKKKIALKTVANLLP